MASKTVVDAGGTAETVGVVASWRLQEASSRLVAMNRAILGELRMSAFSSNEAGILNADQARRLMDRAARRHYVCIRTRLALAVPGNCILGQEGFEPSTKGL
jgi:hypothetical protein